MTAALFALLALCPAHADLARDVEAAAARYRVDPVALVVLIHAESGCRSGAVNPRTGAAGLMQVLVEGDANPAHLTTAALMDPARNVDLGASKLARLLALCGGLGASLTLYHGGGKKDAKGRTRCQIDDHARKLLRRVGKIKSEYKRTQERKA